MLGGMLERIRFHHLAAGLVGVVLAVWWLRDAAQYTGHETTFSMRFGAAAIGGVIAGGALEWAIQLLPIVRALLPGKGRH